MNLPVPEGKPKLINPIGWCFVGFGAIGLVLSLLTLPSLFQIDQIKHSFNQPSLMVIPGFYDFLNMVFDLMVPFTVGQIILSGLMTWFGWEFMKRKNWARLWLSFLNALVIVSVVLSHILFWRLFVRMATSVGLYEMVEQGMIQNIPMMMGWGLFASAFLLALPLFWMGWYFHSKRVVDYFVPSSPNVVVGDPHLKKGVDEDLGPEFPPSRE